MDLFIYLASYYDDDGNDKAAVNSPLQNNVNPPLQGSQDQPLQGNQDPLNAPSQQDQNQVNVPPQGSQNQVNALLQQNENPANSPLDQSKVKNIFGDESDSARDPPTSNVFSNKNNNKENRLAENDRSK